MSPRGANRARRVVVTGMGAVTPLGHTVQQTWQGLLEGRCGVDTISLFDASRFETRVGGEVRSFPFESLNPDPLIAEVLDRKNAFGYAAAQQAMADAGLLHPGEGALEPGRFGISLGTEGRRDNLLPELDRK